MSRTNHIFRLVAAAFAVAAIAAPSAFADPPQLRVQQQSVDGDQLQNWRLLEQLETRGSGSVRADVDGYQPQLHGGFQPRGVVGRSIGYERPDGSQPQLQASATAPAASDGVDWLDGTIGAAIGLALAFVLFASAQIGRRRTRIAHS